MKSNLFYYENNSIEKVYSLLSQFLNHEDNTNINYSVNNLSIIKKKNDDYLQYLVRFMKHEKYEQRMKCTMKTPTESGGFNSAVSYPIRDLDNATENKQFKDPDYRRLKSKLIIVALQKLNETETDLTLEFINHENYREQRPAISFPYLNVDYNAQYLPQLIANEKIFDNAEMRETRSGFHVINDTKSDNKKTDEQKEFEKNQAIERELFVKNYHKTKFCITKNHINAVFERTYFKTSLQEVDQDVNIFSRKHSMPMFKSFVPENNNDFIFQDNHENEIEQFKKIRARTKEIDEKNYGLSLNQLKSLKNNLYENKSSYIKTSEEKENTLSYKVIIEEKYPFQFAALRSVFGISNNKFKQSILQGYITNNSGGQSSSKFIPTEDGLFTIKVNENKIEFDHFFKHIKEYFTYMMKDIAEEGKPSVLTRIFGLYVIINKINKKEKEYLIVMENIKYGMNNIDKTYDQKGSELNRLSKVPVIDENWLDSVFLDTNYKIDRNGDPL